MARIAGIEDSRAGAFARFAYSQARKLLGKIPEPMKIMAHHSTLFKGDALFEYFFGRAKLLDAKLKALAEIKTSNLVGCPW